MKSNADTDNEADLDMLLSVEPPRTRDVSGEETTSWKTTLGVTLTLALLFLIAALA
jgi:hypothetical protein